jgi:hypothetical protein
LSLARSATLNGMAERERPTLSPDERILQLKQDIYLVQE